MYRDATLGPPSGAARYNVDFSGFVDDAELSPVMRKLVREGLSTAASHWVGQMSKPPLVVACPSELRFYFEVDDVPLRLDIVIEIQVIDEEQFFSTRVWLKGPAPSEVGTLRLRPQTFGDDMLAFVGLRDESFGDEEFDALYYVEGDRETLDAVLTADIREGLVRLAKEEPPVMTVERGVASVRLGLQRLSSACILLVRLARLAAKA